jgi:hypothetical protein
MGVESAKSARQKLNIMPRQPVRAVVEKSNGWEFQYHVAS